MSSWWQLCFIYVLCGIYNHLLSVQQTWVTYRPRHIRIKHSSHNFTLQHFKKRITNITNATTLQKFKCFKLIFASKNLTWKRELQMHNTLHGTMAWSSLFSWIFPWLVTSKIARVRGGREVERKGKFSHVTNWPRSFLSWWRLEREAERKWDLVEKRVVGLYEN